MRIQTGRPGVYSETPAALTDSFVIRHAQPGNEGMGELRTGKAGHPQPVDTKDLRFRMGMAEIRITEPEQRDPLLLISAFAMALLTMLGTAGESLGMDRLLESNMPKRRTHSLFRQGCVLYELIPNMPDHRLVPLMQRFAEMLISSGLFGGFLSAAK